MSSLRTSPGWKILCAFVALAVAVASIALWYEQNTVLLFILGVPVVLLLFFRRSYPQEIALLLAGAVIGPAMEMILIRAGAWSYANPTAGGIPLWLPCLWGLAAFALTKMASWIVEMGSARKQPLKQSDLF